MKMNFNTLEEPKLVENDLEYMALLDGKPII